MIGFPVTRRLAWPDDVFLGISPGSAQEQAKRQEETARVQMHILEAFPQAAKLFTAVAQMRL